MLNFMCMFIIMSISVKRHELWCTVRDMRLSKCSIMIIIIIIISVTFTNKLMLLTYFVHLFLLLLLSGTLFQMMSGVPHHCHHLSLV